MYKLDATVGTQIKDTAIGSWNNSWKTFFPGSTFSILLLNFVIAGFLMGLLIKLLTPKKGGSPEYH